MLNDIAFRRALPWYCARDQTGVICHGRTGVGDLHGGAIGDGLEQAQEGDLMGREARVRRGGAADLGDVDGSASQRRENEALGKSPMARESQVLGR